jgi:hypothetical protein
VWCLQPERRADGANRLARTKTDVDAQPQGRHARQAAAPVGVRRVQLRLEASLLDSADAAVVNAIARVVSRTWSDPRTPDAS